MLHKGDQRSGDQGMELFVKENQTFSQIFQGYSKGRVCLRGKRGETHGHWDKRGVSVEKDFHEDKKLGTRGDLSSRGSQSMVWGS